MSKKKIKTLHSKRTEFVQVRLSPRLRYALEIMSRYEHRFSSGFIEHLIYQAMLTNTIKFSKNSLLSGKNLPEIKAVDLLEKIWHIHPAHRLVLLALYLPELLTETEERIWHFMQQQSEYDLPHQSRFSFPNNYSDTLFQNIRWPEIENHWELLTQNQEKTVAALLKNKKDQLN